MPCYDQSDNGKMTQKFCGLNSSFDMLLETAQLTGKEFSLGHIVNIFSVV